MYKITVPVLLLLVIGALGDNSASKHVKMNKAGRLYDGELSSSGQFPYVVGLREPGSYRCGGVIISPKHVLTEAWCATGLQPSTSITAGCIDIYSSDCVEYSFETIYIHPNYTLIGVNDLAIISVVGNIKMNKLVQSIPIATDVIEENSLATVMGWSPSLKWNNVTIAKEADCYQNWGISNEMALCTTPGGVTGWGDYGCPVVVDGLLVGFPLLTGGVDLHQRLNNYVDWINSVIYK